MNITKQLFKKIVSDEVLWQALVEAKDVYESGDKEQLENIYQDVSDYLYSNSKND